MSLSKSIRKVVTKNPTATMAFDFVDDEKWFSSGNYAINKLLSGSYYRAYLFGRSVGIGGMSGSGKSLQAAIAAAQAQQQYDAFVIWADAEKATTGRSGKDWLGRLGVKTGEDDLLYVEVATIEDIKSLYSDVVKEMRKDPSMRPVVFVCDSIGMLMTQSQMEAAVGGEVKGDQGQSAKQKKDMIISITHLSTRLPIVFIGIVHTMASQDQYDPDEKLTGGRGIEYAASSVIVVNKMKLRIDQLEKSSKLDIEKDDVKKVIGIRSKVQVYKSRFSKPNVSVQIQIPWPHGMDPYSGLFDLMQAIGDVQKPAVGWYSYRTKDGKEIKFREKEFRDHADEIMRLAESDLLTTVDVEVPVDPEEEEIRRMLEEESAGSQPE